MTESIYDFVRLFGAELSLPRSLIVKKRNRFFLLTTNLRKLALNDFVYAGVFLGKVRNGRFFPGFDLLRMIAEQKANRVFVDKKTEWLFICGRDIFRQGITKVTGLGRNGDYVLVLNQHGECLGFGQVVHDLDKQKDGVIIRNILDIGDFLRREKQM